MPTGISWTDETWNPLLGCERVSDGCDGCYAIRTANRWAHSTNPKVAAAFTGLVDRRGGRLDWTGQVNLLADRLSQPQRWRNPRRIFVNSQSDLFHDQVPIDFIARVFAVMAVTGRHTYQLLTKRHARMRSVLRTPEFRDLVAEHATQIIGSTPAARGRSLDLGGQRLAGDSGLGGQWTVTSAAGGDQWSPPWPLPNVWLGISVEDQRWADTRIPALLDTPAAIRWISAEPLLGPIDLTPYVARQVPVTDELLDAPDGAVVNGMERVGRTWERHTGLDWVVVGGESGPTARPMHPAWARSLRDQAVAAGVGYFFKQWGTNHPAATQIVVNDDVWTLRLCGTTKESWTFRPGPKDFDLLDGRTWQEYPKAVAACAP